MVTVSSVVRKNKRHFHSAKGEVEESLRNRWAGGAPIIAVERHRAQTTLALLTPGKVSCTSISAIGLNSGSFS